MLILRRNTMLNIFNSMQICVIKKKIVSREYRL
jgi:hypothetical protein